MKNKYSKIYVLIGFCGCLLLSIQNLEAQSVTNLFKDQKELGDKYYKEFSYVKAIKAYTKALNEGTDNQEQVMLRIAESYKFINDTDNASTWYAKALDNNNIEVEAYHYLNFAETLSSSQNYADSKKWLQKYEQLIEEERAKNKIAGIDNQKHFYRNTVDVTIKKADFNSDQSDFSPTYYNNDIVFVSARRISDMMPSVYNWDHTEFLDLYKVTANGEISRFHQQINTKYHEGPAAFYANGRKMIFTRNNFSKGRARKSDKGIVNLKIYSAEMKSNGKWSKAESMVFNNDNYSVGHPTLNEDGTVLYFSSNMPGGFGGVDLYKSEFINGQWSQPVNLGNEINTEGDELFPYLQKNQELYFSSTGHGGLGGLDIFGIDISEEGQSSVINLGAPINSSKDDFGIIMTEQGLSGYFTTNREEGKNKDDIYTFVTTRSLLLSYRVFGTIVDHQLINEIPNANVILKDNDNNVIKKMQTDSLGGYSFFVNPDEVYSLQVSKEGYLANSKDFNTTETGVIEWEENLTMLKDYQFGLSGIVNNKSTSEPIDSVRVTIINNFSDEKASDLVTNANGEFDYEILEKKLNDRVSYQIKFAKDGYLSKTVTFNSELEKPGKLLIHKALDITLDKIEIGTDIGKLINVKPIYFDIGKSTIREDAASELDKIVEIMIDNPNIEIELGSHTDSRGSASSNERLSDRRAKSSANYIISKGVDQNRIVGKGFGEAMLINQCGDGVKCSEDEHQLNRRTEFKITKY